ncbi:MAG TPA: helix-turn-helix transcriptional regulator [Thermoanaerobaculia bacterium]|nr:helix-turn-helix transcriptional regulator [Thermoanaerobaculia bacterium]
MDRQAKSSGPETSGVLQARVRAVGRRIGELRTLRGWTQRELCRRTGIDPARLSRIEKGATPKLEELLRIGAALNAGLEDLVLPDEAPSAGEVARLARNLERLAPEERQIVLRVVQAAILGFRCHTTDPELEANHHSQERQA